MPQDLEVGEDSPDGFSIFFSFLWRVKDKKGTLFQQFSHGAGTIQAANTQICMLIMTFFDRWQKRVLTNFVYEDTFLTDGRKAKSFRKSLFLTQLKALFRLLVTLAISKCKTKNVLSSILFMPTQWWMPCNPSS